jgi:hypothetical protein
MVLYVKAGGTYNDHWALMINQPYIGLHGVTAQTTAVLILITRGNRNLISVIPVIICIGILLISLASMTSVHQLYNISGIGTQKGFGD